MASNSLIRVYAVCVTCDERWLEGIWPDGAKPVSRQLCPRCDAPPPHVLSEERQPELDGLVEPGHGRPR